MQNKLSRTTRKLGLAAALLCFTFLLAGINQVEARSGHRHYYHNNQSTYRSDYNRRNSQVYRDRYGYYHRYENRDTRRGYWNNNNGIRFWVNLF